MSLEIRPATREDSRSIWIWRNDPLMRANARNSDEVSWKQHEDWFAGRLAAPKECRIYIAESQGQPCAMLRFDQREALLWELSWNVAPDFRGRGVGGEVLKKAVMLHPWSLIAFIKQSNLPSIRIAEAAGFLRTAQGSDGVDEFRFVLK
jgi:L-amino acid N-acyltransferase YncA